ncbi:MAG: hypothetical protein ACOVNU_05425 [Candidatus Kapaibacteriota bacterium]|jgi:hypothetical protein
MKKVLFYILIIFAINISISKSQIRVAVLPFQNMDGKIEKNMICYDLQDSVYKLLSTKDPEHKYFYLVQSDSVETVLASLNLDPSNPQYTSDLWKAVKLLNIKKVVMGNFNLQADKILLNGYIYDTKMKLADANNQIRDIFKEENTVLESVNDIVNAILPALIPKQ